MQRIGMLHKVTLAAALALTVASSALADQSVNGHFRRNGTYVQPHYRSDPDSSFSNNWSTYGNVNPYNGQRGTKRYPGYSSPSYPSFSSPSWSSRSYQWR